MKSWRDEAQALLDRLEPDHPKEFFHALGDLVTKRFPRGPGKPKGTGEVDDSARLERIAELLIFREVEDEEAAVLQVAKEDPGADEKSKSLIRAHLDDYEVLEAELRHVASDRAVSRRR